MTKKEKMTNKESRRDFLKKAALGAIGGSALLAGLGISGKAAKRLMTKISDNHANAFFLRASQTSPTENDQAAFTSVLNDVTELVDGNQALKENASRLFNTVIESVRQFDTGGRISILGIEADKTNLLAVAYLGGLSALRTGIPSRERITDVLSNPSSVEILMEPGFVDSLFQKANEAIGSDFEFSRNAGTAVTQLTQFSGVGEGLHDCWPLINIENNVPCWVPYLVIGIIVVLAVVTICIL